MNLNQAPADVQLAVDLIELLEVSKVDSKVALKALALVTADFERKLAAKKMSGAADNT